MDKKVIIFSAPSGAGKSTIVRHLLSKFSCLEFSVSATSRAPRGQEEHGKDYYFFSTEEFEKKIGLQFLKGMHLNDAKGVCGGRLDRHDSIGKGNIGIDTFKRLLQDKRCEEIPLILETPDESIWAAEIALLKSFNSND